MRVLGRLLIVFLVVVAAAPWAIADDPARLEVASTTAPVGGTAQVKVTVGGAREVGAMDLDLRYDPEVLRFVAIERGPAAQQALADSNAIQPGRLLIALAASDGLADAGLLLTASFDVLGAEGARSPVAVEAANAYHFEELIDLPLQTTGGEVVVGAAHSLVAYLFLGGLGIVVLLLLVMVVARRRS